MITPELIIEDFGEQLVKDIRAKLIAEGVTFGGGGESKLGASTRFEIVRTSNGLEFHLIMPEEWYWVDKGRKSGKVSQKGKESIEYWGERKGYIGDFINKDLKRRQDLRADTKRKNLKPLKKLPFDKAKQAFGFVVARTIGKKGYEGNNFLTETINDGRVKILFKDLLEFTKNGNNSNS